MKRKYILSGGSGGRVKYTQGWKGSVYGFEHLSRMFDPEKWEGEYICREEVFANPSLLDGCRLWILITEWGFKDRPEVLKAIRYAKSKGIIVGGEQNGPYYATTLCTSPADVALRRELNFLQNPSNSAEITAATEKIYGIPYFSAPPPIVEADFRDDYEKTQAFPLPYKEGEFFVFGHAVNEINFCTLQVAEHFGIPLIVNVWNRGGGYGAWINVIEKEGGFKHVKFTEQLSHPQWLYQMKMSRGLFYLTYHPSGGRPMLYAAMAGKISLSTNAGWQQLLFPESVVKPDFTAGVDWQQKAAEAESLLPKVRERIAEFTPEKCSARFEAFLQRYGWQ